jgi:uncharacterized alpha-E superfamily protein
MRETLKMIAPRNKENPRTVLLTPGPFNETYFEHAYLARYLGYTLVEGADLTVRDNRVFLKTLAGLQNVDVIVRRLDDDFCDPLELWPDSTLGTAGLVQSCHAQQVAVVNALGTGVIESPAFLGFLPRLCRHLLSEDLILPSVTTYWCGDESQRQYVLENLPKLVIKRTSQAVGNPAVFGAHLSANRLNELRAKILATPWEFVGEEQIELSTAPVLINGRMEPRHVTLRAHLVADVEKGGAYAVMPGALARFSGSADSMMVSMQKGGGSKDVWILSGGPVDNFSLLQPQGAAIELNRSGGDLPSRVADNLFWLGRYLERAEGLVRLARGVVTRLTDQSVETSPELPVLVGDLRRASGEPPPLPSARAEDEVLHILNSSAAGSLMATLEDAYRVAGLVRDRISVDAWRVVSRLDTEFLVPRRGGHVNGPTLDHHGQTIEMSEALPVLDRLVVTFSAFSGLLAESMTRGFAWRFLDMGRRIERAMHTAELLRGTLVNVLTPERPLLEAVLEIADSAMTYRRRYLTALEAAGVVDLLLADETNPRSVAFQLEQLSEHIEALPHNSAAARRDPVSRFILKALSAVRLVDAQAETTLDQTGRRDKLEIFLVETLNSLTMLSEVVSQSYLSHSLVSRQLNSSPNTV